MKAIFVDKRTEELENYMLEEEVNEELAQKVDKEIPKGLSTNDFTNDYKANVDANNLKVSFPEAPLDNKEYVRKNGDWKVSDILGQDGDSAYEVAVANGFVGTQAEWLDSLVGGKGVGLNYLWNLTKLGVKREDEDTYNFVDLLGPKGVGVVSIEKTNTIGLIDIYTITYTDNTTSTFQVTNGKDAEDPGDMLASVYDPASKQLDVYNYINMYNIPTKLSQFTNDPDFASKQFVLDNAGDEATWGNITGILSSQIDLITLLNKKIESTDARLSDARVPTTHGSDKHSVSYLTSETDPVFVSSEAYKFASGDKNKLDTIESNANNYVHPANHPASIISQTSSYRFVTDAEKVEWNGKSNFSGSYNDLSYKPTIPTSLSQLTQAATHRTVSDTEKNTWNDKQDKLNSGTNIKTINGNNLLGSGNIATPNTTYSEITEDEIDVGTASTGKLLSGRRAKFMLDKKQDTLVSSANIKTINGSPILGSGNIEITSGLAGTIISSDESVTDIMSLTKAEYDALPQIDKDNNTYFIKDDLDGSFDITYIFDKVYPIGRGFIDFTDIDYSGYLGFTWEKTCVGMFPVGKDSTQTEFNTVGKKGGSKTHTLTVAELASHGHVGALTAPGAYLDADYVLNTDWYWSSNKVGQFGKTNQDTGGNQPHNNLPPYQVVNYWKRVS